MLHAAARLRIDLVAARARGVPFAEAWDPALEHALVAVPRGERRAWRMALTSTRRGWEAAYEGRAATRAQHAAYALAFDPDRRPLTADVGTTTICATPSAREWRPQASLCTLQEWMGHRDHKTTLIYADCPPIAHERELVERAFGGGATIGDTRADENTTARR